MISTSVCFFLHVHDLDFLFFTFKVLYHLSFISNSFSSCYKHGLGAKMVYIIFIRASTTHAWFIETSCD